MMGILSQIKEMMSEIKDIKSEAVENKILCEKEKELREVEKKFLRQINDAKILSENTMETVKKSFYTELQVLKVLKNLFSLLTKINRTKKNKWKNPEKIIY